MGIVSDPYTPEALHKEREKLQLKLKEGGDIDDYAVFCTGLAVTLGVVTFVITSAVMLFTNWSWSSFIVPEALAIGGPTSLFFVLAAQKIYRKKCLRKLDPEPYFIDGQQGGYYWLEKLSRHLCRLPRSRREEFRPLWLAALEANEVLRVAPGNELAIKRIRERAEAAERIVEAEQAMADAQRKDAAELVRAGSVKSLEAADDSDLALAAIYASALEEGKDKLEQLTRQTA